MRLYQKLAIVSAALAAGIAGACGLSSMGSNRENSARPSLERTIIQEPEVTEANKQLRDFPRSFGPYGTVKKYENPNAKYCLAHVKQKHDLPEGYHIPSVKEIEEGNTKYEEDGRRLTKQETKDTFRGVYSNLNKVQGNIGGVLNHLIDNQGLKQVRIEGYMVEDPVADGLKTYYNSEVKRLIGQGYSDSKADVQWIPGAPLKLAVERDLKLMPAEKRKAFAHYTKTGKHDQRENALLELVAEYGKPFSVATYGANHDFRDNIDSWNSKYPTKKFSLVEVTPGKLGNRK